MASGSCVGRNRKRSASASWSRPDGDTSTRKAPKRQSRLPYKKQRVSVNVGKNADAADSSKAMYRSNISGVIKTVLELDFGEGHIREIRKTPFAAMVDAIRAHNLIPQSFKKCDATVCRIIKTYNPEDEKFHIGGAKLPLRNNDIRLIFGLQCGKDKLDLSVHCDKLVGTIRECHIIKPEPVLIDHSEAGQNVMNVDPVNEGRNVDPSFNCWQKDSADGGDVRKDKDGKPASKKKVEGKKMGNGGVWAVLFPDLPNRCESTRRAATNSRSGDSNGADTKRSSDAAQQSSSYAGQTKGLASPTHEVVLIDHLGEDVSIACADGYVCSSVAGVDCKRNSHSVQENSIHGNVIDAYGAMLTDMHRTVSGRREYQGTAYVYSSVCADMMRNTSAVSRTKYLNVHARVLSSNFVLALFYYYVRLLCFKSDNGSDLQGSNLCCFGARLQFNYQVIKAAVLFLLLCLELVALRNLETLDISINGYHGGEFTGD
ncbi:hypothetical protein LOK49_Contig53G00014 [Camellia lanceoleosa]|nr:hypothetical protein LOK49_Contig53G00014 [Camellia lanceoleosa]